MRETVTALVAAGAAREEAMVLEEMTSRVRRSVRSARMDPLLEVMTLAAAAVTVEGNTRRVLLSSRTHPR